MAREGIPLSFRTLDPAEARRAVEGIPCVLDDEHRKAEALYRQHTHCPNGCGPTMEKASAGVAFAFADKDWRIPRCVMKCYTCGCSINPFDGMVVELGNRDKARYGDVPIINPKS